MFYPKLIKNVAIYKFTNNLTNTDGVLVDTEEDAARLQRTFGIAGKLPYKHGINCFQSYPLLNNVEIGAYSSVRIGMEPSSIYCKLGDFSKFEIDGEAHDGISPHRCVSVIGGDFCKVSVRVSPYASFYRNVPDPDNHRFSTKERIDPDMTGLALKGDSFELRFEISRNSIYMNISRVFGDLSVYHQGELVAVVPSGFIWSNSLYNDNKWKWSLRRAIKNFLKEEKY